MPAFSGGYRPKFRRQSHQFSEVVPVNSCRMAYRDRRSLIVGVGRRALGLALAAALVAGGASCASTGAGAAPSGPPKTFTAAELYPLDAGWKWAYDLVKDGQTML